MSAEKEFKIRQIKILSFIVVICGLMLFTFQNCSSGIRLFQGSTAPSHAGKSKIMFNEAINSSINNMREIEKNTFGKESKAQRAPTSNEKITSEDAQIYLRYKKRIEVQKNPEELPAK